jgi:hypothetical protein
MEFSDGIYVMRPKAASIGEGMSIVQLDLLHFAVIVKPLYHLPGSPFSPRVRRYGTFREAANPSVSSYRTAELLDDTLLHQSGRYPVLKTQSG